jgi:transcriptional regulator with XRE-family HTH domain
MSVAPEQCRAGRALLNWSQEDLETASKVAKKTIADFERGAQLPYQRTLSEIEVAFAAHGVVMIPENGGGVGVRRTASFPRLVRSRVSRFDRLASFSVSYKGSEYRVRLPTDVLDDLDRTSHRSDEAMSSSFENHRSLILVRAASAIDNGRSDSAGDVLLTQDDFPEA